MYSILQMQFNERHLCNSHIFLHTIKLFKLKNMLNDNIKFNNACKINQIINSIVYRYIFLEIKKNMLWGF